MEGYQSGQLGRTVNPLRKLSMFESYPLHHTFWGVAKW